MKGTLASLLVFTNTVFWCLPLYLLSILKLIPWRPWQIGLSKVMVKMAECWISVNSLTLTLLQTVKWRLRGMEQLDPQRSYLVLVNHQSWVDIVVLQHLLNRRIPFLRFFLKRELIWVPFLGLAWWALDFPFMKRHSADYLLKHPEKRGEDLRATQKACEKLRGLKISVLNFAEGTRFTAHKHQRSSSPYKNLLKPKTGGIAFVLEAMGNQFHSLLDVTMVYPGRVPSFWDLLSGRLGEVRFTVREVAIPPDLLHSGYLADDSHRKRAQTWIQGLWREKDQLISNGG